MTKLHCRHALLPEGWHDDVLIDIRQGLIERAESNVASLPDGARRIEGAVVPGMVNVHSHAFQYAFAGLSEYRTAQHDSFWTWRQLMYEFLERLTPEEVHSIGKRLYQKMLAAGYSAVGEFHYLLHQPDGTPYDNVNEMADALIDAALKVGLKICMLPVLYQRGGFGDEPLQGGQLRFGSTNELFLKMIDKLKTDWGDHPQVRIGMALHSLRAVSVPAATETIAGAQSLLPELPIHIHVAEQTAEVDECLSAHGQRPVEFLFNSFEVNERWCLIHATHMNDHECRRLASSGAIAGVCPTTEANLGDGLFSSESFLHRKGQLAIGSDSHVSVDPCEELRLLEYGQRLVQMRRAILCDHEQSCGHLLYTWAARGGAAATGFGNGRLEAGQPAHFSHIRTSMENSFSRERLLDVAIFHHCRHEPRIVVSNLALDAVPSGS